MPPPHFQRHHRIYWLWLPLLIFCLWGLYTSLSLSSAKAGDRSAKAVAQTTAYQPKYEYLHAHPVQLPIEAHAAILIDEDSDQILYAKNEREALPPASIIKMLTVAVALGSGNPDRLLLVTHRAATIEPNIMGLKEGERVSVNDLLHGIFMVSANDAAETLAAGSYPSRGLFIQQMNLLAQTLEMNQTRVDNPTGLDDPSTHSSAFDVATITRYALEKYPVIAKDWDMKELSIPATPTHGPYYLYNVSDLIYTYPPLNGVKTGFTDNAGHTLIASAAKGSRHLLLVYFNDSQGIQDAKTMFNYGFSLPAIN